MSYYPTFRDGKRPINFILVYKESALITESAATRHKNFTETLEALGLQLEKEIFSVDEDVVFIKVHMPNEFVVSYADLFDIELTYRTSDYRPYVQPPPEFLATPLTRPNANDPIYARAPESISGEIPKEITTAEQIMVVNQILNRCVWGEGRGDYGIDKLINANVFVDAFPLHDGDYKWTPSGPLNDRQLLALYWGTPKCWRKAQPLTLVEKYFGTEYALYFAWLGMYITHLIPAAILSVLVVLYGVITMFTSLNSHSQYICASDIVMCPRCHYSKCPMELLSNSCYVANLTYLFDNWCAVLFSAIMSLWATVFMEFWQREEAVFQLQWNVKSLEHTINIRPEYIEKASKRKYSPITGRLEPYKTKTDTACRYIFTFISVALLLIIMIAATFGVMVYRVTVNMLLVKSSSIEIVRSKFRGLIASVTGAFLSGIFIFIFKWLYEQIALSLTNMENHRTHRSFSNAYIYKSYALAFANNYAAVFYIAFFKGKFFTHPGDLNLLKYLGGINTDVCDPTGCIVDLAILLVIIMVLKAFMNNVAQVIVPKLKRRLHQTIRKVKNAEIPQWENEFLLAKAEEFFIVDEYMDMVIQYGFVNFFIMGFPLAPLLALLNNMGELRVDSSKVTKSYRRPVPQRVSGLGAWFGILQATTYIGVVTNALVIAFSSTFMEKTIWHVLRGTQTGSLNQTLSVFDLSEFHILRNSIGGKLARQKRFCYYQGQRYPPDHALKYKRRRDFWQHLGLKFATVVLFEHIVIIIKGFLAYAIPDVPFSVKQQLMYQEKMSKKARINEINEAYIKQREINIRKMEANKSKSDDVQKDSDL